MATRLRDRLAPYAVAYLVTAVFLVLTASGYSAMDDRHYVEAADRWLDHPPFIGGNHWHMRLPSVLAIALSFRLFGPTELALMLPTLLAYAGLVGLTVHLVASVADRFAAALAGAFVAATPVFALYAKIPYPDEIETFLVALSTYCFWSGARRREPGLLLASGLAIGVSWLMRASCAPLIFLYLVLFLRGYAMPRRFYGFIAAGFLPLILAELAFYYVETSNAFYRFAVDARGMEIPSAHMVGGSAGGLHPPFNWRLMARWVPNSIVDVHWTLNPYIDFVTNGSYGVIYACALAGGWRLHRRGDRSSTAAQLRRLLAAMSLVLIFSSST